jgi:hypothetical protein
VTGKQLNNLGVGAGYQLKNSGVGDRVAIEEFRRRSPNQCHPSREVAYPKARISCYEKRDHWPQITGDVGVKMRSRSNTEIVS